MKNSSKQGALQCLFLALLVLKADPVLSQGTLVANNIVFSQPGGAPPGTYITQVAYPGDAGGLFSLSVTTLGVGQYRFNYWGIAEAYSVHAATAGLAFTPAYVLGDTPLLNNNNNPGEFQISLTVGQSMFFAYWDNALYMPNSPQPGAPGTPGVDAYDAYGWFRLTRTVSGLTISDSATAMGSGIFVGTYSVVPEPSYAALGMFALLGLMFRRKF